MANIRFKRGSRSAINAAAAASGLAAGEPYLITDESRIAVGTAANTYKAFVRQDDAIAAPEIHAATSKTTPVDADELGIVDSATSNVLKKLTFANLAAWVRGIALAGLSTATNAVITASDTVLGALGKLQKQISDHLADTTGAHAASAISNTPAGGIAATTVQGAINELDTEKAAVAAVREKLTAARSYYVRSDGSDSNNGLTDSSGGAFLTVQKAVDTAASIDLGIYDVTIYVGAGTWTAATTLKTLVGAGKVIIRGINADMTSTVVHTTGASCFSGAFAGRYRFEWLRLQTTTSGYCISAFGGGAAVEWANVDFGSAAAESHVICASGARAESVGPYKISGGGYAHAAAYDNATLQLGAHTTTITGTPAFSGGFVVSDRGSSAVAVGPSFSGSATGPRYRATLNGTIITLGGETFLPGNASGVKDSGGQYA